MSFTDPIADMITRIRNAQLRKLNTVSIPNSRFRAKILDVLRDEGYISNYKILSENQNTKSLIVDLKYNNGMPVIKDISRVSKPGRRVYAKANSIPKIQNVLGIFPIRIIQPTFVYKPLYWICCWFIINGKYILC